MSRRVDIVAPPFAGHLHPALGLGRALAAVGHAVRVFSTERAAADIAASGLEGVALLAGIDPAIREIVDPPRPVRSNPVRLLRQLRASVALLGRFSAELGAHWDQRRPDLAIVDFALPAGGWLAQARGISWWTSHPAPCVIEAPDGPPAYLGGLSPAAGALGHVRDALGRRLIRGFKRAAVWLHRRRLRALGLRSLYRADGTEAAYSPERILALALPELEFPRSWPLALRWVGPVLYTPPSPRAWELPAMTGRPRVLVTLGTHLRMHQERAIAATRTAARARPEWNWDFSAGNPVGDYAPRDGNFCSLAWVPYDRAVGSYDLVVHHGGTGILHHTLAAGRPALVWPLDYDQFDQAARLVAAGLARRLSHPGALAEEAAQVLGDTATAERCRSFAKLVAARDAARAVCGLVRDTLTGSDAG